jgi:hypothetical protein
MTENYLSIIDVHKEFEYFKIKGGQTNYDIRLKFNGLKWNGFEG